MYLYYLFRLCGFIYSFIGRNTHFAARLHQKYIYVHSFYILGHLVMGGIYL